MASKMWGDWSRLKNLAVRMNNLINKEQLQERLDMLGEEILAKVKENIFNNSLPLAPLSDAYLRKKGEGLPILVRTGEWVNALEVKSVSLSANGITVFIGGGNEELLGGLTVAELTSYIEEGTMYQPGRPVSLRNVSWPPAVLILCASR